MLIFLKILAHIASALKFEMQFVKLAFKMQENLLEILLKNCKVVFICGSCGKTTTLMQCKAAIKATGAKCIGGSAENYGQVVCAMLKNYCDEENFVIFEADAENLGEITKYIKPYAAAVTNIFTDKNPDENIYEKIEAALNDCEETILVLNGDEPMLYNFFENRRRFFYGFRINPMFPGGNVSDEEGKICPHCNQPYKYIYNTYAHLGNFSCDICGKTRPQLALGVDRVDVMNENMSTVSFDGIIVDVPIPGGSNIYNALCSATLAAAVGVEPDYIKEGIESVKSIAGVHEKVKIDTKDLSLISVGSALDFTESVNSIIADEGVLYIALLIDKEEANWLSAVPFEKFINLNYHGILIGGEGRKEMIARLESAGLDSAKFIECDDFDGFHYAIRTNVIGKTYVFANKKLMKSLRKNLYKKKYIKKL